MKALLVLCSFILASPVLAQESPDVQVVQRLGGMDIEVEWLGVPQAESDKVDLVGVPAVKVTNRSNRIASCRFHAEPQETAMTASPAQSIAPNEQAVMRVPGKYSAGGPRAVLECRPEGD